MSEPTAQRISEIKRFLAGLAGEKYIQPVAKRFLLEAADLIESLRREREERENPKPLTFQQVGDAIDKKPVFYVPERSNELERWLSIRGTMVGYESQRTVFVSNANDPEETRLEWGRGFFYVTEPKGEATCD